MLIGRLLITLGIECIKIFLFYLNELFLIYLLPILAYEFIKYQRGCDTWQVTAKIAQPCIFLTKSHECTVNCAISTRNFSNHYIISRPLWRHRNALREWWLRHYPTLAREFQGFRVWGKFVFRTLELTDTPTNLANQVKVGHALDQSRSVQSRGPERAHQNNEPSWRSSRADRRLSRQVWGD